MVGRRHVAHHRTVSPRRRCAAAMLAVLSRTARRDPARRRSATTVGRPAVAGRLRRPADPAQRAALAATSTQPTSRCLEQRTKANGEPSHLCRPVTRLQRPCRPTGRPSRDILGGARHHVDGGAHREAVDQWSTVAGRLTAGLSRSPDRAQASTSTTSPMTTTAGAPTPARSAAAAISSSGARTTRWSASSARCTTAAGVVGRPAVRDQLRRDQVEPVHRHQQHQRAGVRGQARPVDAVVRPAGPDRGGPTRR